MNLLSSSGKTFLTKNGLCILSGEFSTRKSLFCDVIRYDFYRQDYLYLKYYARAYRCVVFSSHFVLLFQILFSLLAAKSTSFPVIATSTQTILGILQEVENHRSFCAKFVGVSEEDLDITPEASATTAYGAYLIDMGVCRVGLPSFDIRRHPYAWTYSFRRCQ